MPLEIKHFDDVLFLNPGSTHATVELHGNVTSGPGFTGPPALRLGAYVKRPGSNDWVLAGETTKPGIALFVGDVPQMRTNDYIVRLLLGRLGPKPNPYDLKLVFHDQDGVVLPLKTAGPALVFEGSLADPVGGFRLQFVVRPAGAGQ